MRDHAALFSDAPVVGSFQSNGKTILTLCRRDLRDAIVDMGLLTRIVPEVDRDCQNEGIQITLPTVQAPPSKSAILQAA